MIGDSRGPRVVPSLPSAAGRDAALRFVTLVSRESSGSFAVTPEQQGALLPRVLHTRLVARERRGQRPIPVFLKAG